MLHHEAKRSARFIQPEKPWQNEFIESFHSTLRRNHLDVDVFYNLLDAELKTGIYRNDSNLVRAHSALSDQPPAEVARMKGGSVMVPLGYQLGADHRRQTEFTDIMLRYWNSTSNVVRNS